MFTFNGIDFSTKNIKVSEIKRPLIAPQKISTTSIEGKAGEIFNRKVSDIFNVDVDFYLFGATPMELIADIRELAGDLDSQVPAKLIFKDEPDKYVMAIVESTEIEKRGRHAIISISFRCSDPYWYAIQDDIFDYETVGAKAVVRKGNAESYPIIEIKGTSSTSGKFGIGANGSMLNYTGSLTAGETLVIDSERLTAYTRNANGVVSSALSKLDVLDFPVLTKGDNNFVLSATNGANLTTCKLICNSRWK